MKSRCLAKGQYVDENAKEKFDMLCHLEDFEIKYWELQQENKKLNGAIQTYDILLKSNVEENKQLKNLLDIILNFSFFKGECPLNFGFENNTNEDKSQSVFYEDEWCDNKYNLNYGTAQERKAQKHNKPILQFDLNGNFIKEYESITQASKELNIKIDYISSCCLGRRRKTKGYVFKFKNDKEILSKFKEIIGDDK